jgi:hypothetical protein
MLSFSLDESGKQIQIHCDAKGMATLLDRLAGLVRERASRAHLRGPESGGRDLDANTPLDAITSVVIDYAEGD